MNERPPNKVESKSPGREGWARDESAILRIEAIVALARELGESHESLPFTGIEPEAYSKLKANDEEDPGYTTPIDEIINRFEHEGMKVILGKNPESGNVYILPAQSNDIEQDSVHPKYLQISDGMDEKLKELILLVRG